MPTVGTGLRSERADYPHRSTHDATKEGPRGEVLRAIAWPMLSRGSTCSQAAKKIGVAPRTIRSAAAWMVRHQYLSEEAPGARPQLYRRGPRAAVMDSLAESAQMDRGVRSGPRSAGFAARIHRGQYRWGLDGPPRSRPEGAKMWRASGVENWRFPWRYAGKRYRVQEAQGVRRQSIVISTEEEWSTDPAVVGQVGRVVLAEVATAGRALAKAHGYVLVGELVVVQEPEAAFRADGLPSFGKPGIDALHADKSKGYTEIETTVGDAAVAFLQLPEFMHTAVGRLDHIEGAMGQVMAVMDRLLRVQEAGVAVEQRVAMALLGLQEGRQVAPGLAASSLPDDGWDVA